MEETMPKIEHDERLTDPNFLSAGEFAEMIGITTQTLSHHLHKSKLKPYVDEERWVFKHDGTWRIHSHLVSLFPSKIVEGEQVPEGESPKIEHEPTGIELILQRIEEMERRLNPARTLADPEKEVLKERVEDLEKIVEEQKRIMHDMVNRLKPLR